MKSVDMFQQAKLSLRFLQFKLTLSSTEYNSRLIKLNACVFAELNFSDCFTLKI